MASSIVSGNHWSCVQIKLETGDGLYSDSIGREVPRDFEDTFSNFSQYANFMKKYDFFKSMQVAHEIQSTKSAYKFGCFRVKNFINQRNGMIVCRAVVIFSAISMSDFPKATKII